MSNLTVGHVYNTCGIKALSYYELETFLNPVLVLEVDEKAGMVRYASKANEERWISCKEAEKWHDITSEVGVERLDRYKRFVLEHAGELPPNLWEIILHVTCNPHSQVSSCRVLTLLGVYYRFGDSKLTIWRKQGLT